MLHFFRKIRHDLIANSKFYKYFKYAIGEIILVVIGILIALQINNWNERRKLQEESRQIANNLNSEFMNNRIVLRERIDRLENANEYIRTVLSYITKGEKELGQSNMDSLISKSRSYGNYNPSNSTIQELISSGKLDLVGDYELKNNLFSWLQLLEDTDEDFKNQDLHAITMLEAYLYKNAPMKNITTYDSFNIASGKSELFNGDYSEMFNDIEFENLYQIKLFWNTVMVDHFKELDNLAAEIINQTRRLE